MTSGTAIDPLDYPIWTALTTRQSALAEGGALARRYPVAVAPFQCDLASRNRLTVPALFSSNIRRLLER